MSLLNNGLLFIALWPRPDFSAESKICLRNSIVYFSWVYAVQAWKGNSLGAMPCQNGPFYLCKIWLNNKSNKNFVICFVKAFYSYHHAALVSVAGAMVTRLPDWVGDRHSGLRQDLRPIPGCHQPAVLLPAAERENPWRDVCVHGRCPSPGPDGVVRLSVHPADGGIQHSETRAVLYHQHHRGQTPRYQGQGSTGIYIPLVCSSYCS